MTKGILALLPVKPPCSVPEYQALWVKVEKLKQDFIAKNREAWENSFQWKYGPISSKVEDPRGKIVEEFS